MASVPALKTAAEPEVQLAVPTVPAELVLHFLLVPPLVDHVADGVAPAPAVVLFVSQ